jgi:hypothetical protein
MKKYRALKHPELSTDLVEKTLLKNDIDLGEVEIKDFDLNAKDMITLIDLDMLRIEFKEPAVRERMLTDWIQPDLITMPIVT